MPLIGRLRMTMLDLELDPQSTPVLVGGDDLVAAPLPFEAPTGQPACRCGDQ